MLQITAYHPSKSSLKRYTESLDCAIKVLTKLPHYEEIYISMAKSRTDETETVTIQTADLAFDDEITDEERILGTSQRPINLRLGRELQRMVNHVSNQQGMSQNTYILTCLRIALNEELATQSISLQDFSDASKRKSQYSLRLPQGLLDMVDEQCELLGVSRSMWVSWALLYGIARFTKA